MRWTIDPWGNRTDQTLTSGTCFAFHATANTQNQLVGYQYDAAGNMTYDGTHHYTYDAENRLTQVDSGAATYVYDADGNRVQKTSGGVITQYVYDTSGLVLHEIGGTGTFNVHYIYFGGQLAAQMQYSSTYFVHHDHLGSERLMTRVDKSVYDYGDYLPFGEQIAGYAGTTHKFTGKERDSESGLDNFGARYNASTMGRFMSPDPVMVSWRRMVNPQIWNSYSYAGNNPLRFVDPSGEELVQLGQHSDDEIKKRQKEIKQELKNKDLSKDEKDALKKERNTLGLEQQGNHVVAGLLADLDKTGQRNGLQLSNFTLSTDTKNDFAAGHPDAGALQKLLGAQAFVLQGNKQFGGTIYIRTEPETGFYQMSQGNSDFGYYGASALRHEQEHLNGGGEYPAFQRQLSVFEGFQSFFQNPALYRGLDESIREGIKANQP